MAAGTIEVHADPVMFDKVNTDLVYYIVHGSTIFSRHARRDRFRCESFSGRPETSHIHIQCIIPEQSGAMDSLEPLRIAGGQKTNYYSRPDIGDENSAERREPSGGDIDVARSLSDVARS